MIIQAFLRTTLVRVKLERKQRSKARKRAKAKRRERAKLAGDEILGGDANTVDVRMTSGDEDDSSVPLKGRDAFTSIRGVERSLGGAIDGIAICPIFYRYE